MPIDPTQREKAIIAIEAALQRRTDDDRLRLANVYSRNGATYPTVKEALQVCSGFHFDAPQKSENTATPEDLSLRRAVTQSTQNNDSDLTFDPLAALKGQNSRHSKQIAKLIVSANTSKTTVTEEDAIKHADALIDATHMIVVEKANPLPPPTTPEELEARHQFEEQNGVALEEVTERAIALRASPERHYQVREEFNPEILRNFALSLRANQQARMEFVRELNDLVHELYARGHVYPGQCITFESTSAFRPMMTPFNTF